MRPGVGALAGGAQVQPSVAVFDLEAKHGVAPDVSLLLTGHIADRLRGLGLLRAS